MKSAAVYRVLYGEDFIEESIHSVLNAVDKVYVFWTNKVWGDCKAVKYNGEIVKFPEKFDNAVEIVKGIDSPKIELIEHYHPTPHGQFTELVNHYVDADVVILIEHDQIIEDARTALDEFNSSDRIAATLPQIEYWKTKEYRIPDRYRPGPIFWKTPLPHTRPNGAPGWVLPWLQSTIAHNYGFCVSDKTMYWKHLTALAFSPKIGDSLPREDWYEEVWLKWTPEMENLEISKNHPTAIPRAYKIR